MRSAVMQSSMRSQRTLSWLLAMDLLQCCRAVQGFYTALVRGLLVQRCTRAAPDAEPSAINIANDPWESFGTRRLILTLVCPLLICQSVAATDGVAVQTSPVARRGIPSDNMTSISILKFINRLHICRLQTQTVRDPWMLLSHGHNGHNQYYACLVSPVTWLRM